MAQTPLLTEFFLEGQYLTQINRENPLGWQGKIAEEYAQLVKDLWSGKYSTVAPAKFKEVLGEFQPRFSGYDQHDSSELLSFLLDGLHEDLNLVRFLSSSFGALWLILSFSLLGQEEALH
jgi:ubiquitin C-terminal hydrolase